MDWSQIRNFSSGKGSGDDEAENDANDKLTANAEGGAMANAESGATDLGLPGAQKGGKKLAIGKLAVDYIPTVVFCSVRV
jgi:hypothetical protein